MPRTFFIKTFGCTLNKADSIMMENLLEAQGFVQTDLEELADVVIVNTCTVKGSAERKAFSYLNGLEKNKKSYIIAGCMTYDRKRLERIYGKGRVIVQPSGIPTIVYNVKKALGYGTEKRASGTDKYGLEIKSRTGVAPIPTNDGCASYCSYCATKLARPMLRSYSTERIMNNIELAIQNRAYEIQLTSQDLGAYGLDRGTGLLELLNRITELKGKFKLRLGMMNPVHAKRFYKQLIEIINQDSRFYRFLHIPIQSGSDSVLRHMGRGNTAQEFVRIVDYARKEIPDLFLMTDIITAYPTETEKDFRNTLELMRKVSPETTNVSRYSPMKGTSAAELKQIENAEAKRRTKEASELCRKIESEARQRYLGTLQEVLVTEQNKTIVGRMDNYLQVALQGLDKSSIGKTVKARITELRNLTLIGKPE